MILSVELKQAIKQISNILQDKKANWLIGGSFGLFLQGVGLTQPPRDLDIYVDALEAQVVNHALHEYSIDPLQHNQTKLYKSVLSHYTIADVSVEVVGGFEVSSEQTKYQVEVNQLTANHLTIVKIEDITVGLMPLAHELIFNLLRNRPDRYLEIAVTMRTNLKYHQDSLKFLLRRNQISNSLSEQINKLME